MTTLVRQVSRYCSCALPLQPFQFELEAYIRSLPDTSTDHEINQAIQDYINNSSYSKMCCRNQLLNPRLCIMNNSFEARRITPEYKHIPLAFTSLPLEL